VGAGGGAGGGADVVVDLIIELNAVLPSASTGIAEAAVCNAFMLIRFYILFTLKNTINDIYLNSACFSNHLYFFHFPSFHSGKSGHYLRC
jgi:hypothetical protein